jgi:hypothetical protein
MASIPFMMPQPYGYPYPPMGGNMMPMGGNMMPMGGNMMPMAPQNNGVAPQIPMDSSNRVYPGLNPMLNNPMLANSMVNMSGIDGGNNKSSYSIKPQMGSFNSGNSNGNGNFRLGQKEMMNFNGSAMKQLLYGTYQNNSKNNNMRQNKPISNNVNNILSQLK